MLEHYPLGTIHFDSKPARPGIYPLTVTLVTDEGEVFEASAEVEFD